MQRNSMYDDYRRRRARDKWVKRVPALLAMVAALVLVVVVLPRLQRQAALTEVRATVAPQATLTSTATPDALVVMPAETVATMPTATALPTIAATATALLSETPASTQQLATTTPHLLPQGEGSKSFDVPALQRLMLDLINQDRQANGLTAVEWDDSAAQAATAHAEDMAAQGYFSHWNTQGYGPDVRYGLAGGTDAIRENVAAQWRRYDDGRPAPIDDWTALMREVQAGLMNSPGHRANILDLHHTHVGIGIAYNAQTGETRIAQEFINRYITLAPVTNQNGAVLLSGTLLKGASAPLINVAFEPLPKPLMTDELNNVMSKSYSSPAENIAVVRPEMQGDDRFTARVPVGQNGAGLYHIRIWVNVNGEDAPAANVVVPVDAP